MSNAIATRKQVAPVIRAGAVKLRYITDEIPGIRRVMSGKRFHYLDPDGKTVRNRQTLARIRALVIPPAWTDVWICPQADGHIQAIGRDERGRKQYRYHDDYRTAQDAVKFDRIVAFGKVLPRVRKAVARDLAKPGLAKRKVVAAVVKLLETSLIRIGNDEYAKANGSYGLTTMRDRHVEIDGGLMHFHFRGKSGVTHEIDVNDRRLAKIVKACQELPGQELFQYLDDDGTVHDVGSADVNEYLRECAGDDFTAKDFRTWAGTILAAVALKEFEEVDSETQAKRNVMSAIKSVAQRLGNTPAVCRSCYVHPRIIDSYLQGTMLDAMRRRAAGAMAGIHKLTPEEAAVLALLQRRLTKS